MTPSGLYRWPDNLVRTFSVTTDAGEFSCDVWQFGVQLPDAACNLSTTPTDVVLNPDDATDFVGIAPDTPMDLVYPPDGETIEAYLAAADFNPTPDFVDVQYSTLIQEGPIGYHTFCEPPNELGGPRSGGCGGFTPPDVEETVTNPSMVGSLSDGFVVPPSEIAYDGTEEGARLWPYARLGEALLQAGYEGLCHFVRIRYEIVLRLYWEVEPEEPVPGNSTITLGALTRGVRRRVACP